MKITNAFEEAARKATEQALHNNESLKDGQVAIAQLKGARQLVAHIIDLIQESCETDGDFLNTIDRERSPQQWQYFDGYLTARKLDLDHLYRLRDFLKEGQS